ncbi:MAG: ribosome maturation factor RimM [Gammaproteobacteria bacterium]|nr:ribosome maturation factor RimM [Gammaproteobacteria bacterium]MCP5424458.1 ribosome maturation factor RimM [Gammaproteobacteria bacterium]MCP5458452.1 ribosome maturation factor RimM [Gammaproteobacteria bacterium]
MRRNKLLPEANNDSRWIVLGEITGVFGIQGWVRVFSHTQERNGILEYDPLYLADGEEWLPMTIVEAQIHGKGLIAKLSGCTDRDAAAKLVGRALAVRREQLPPTGPGEYYWTDLIGLQVVTQEGVSLGSVDHLFATGANDVLVVKGERERLLPFLKSEVIKAIDLDRGTIQVDWDPAF